jgi:hypothetical protein
MSIYKSGLIVGAGLCGCGVAVLSGELFESKLPSAIVCSSPPIHRDFGPPAGCDNEPSPHNRMGWMISVAASTCQRAAESPHFGACNFPHLAGWRSAVFLISASVFRRSTTTLDRGGRG